jgi:ABC-type antimicrobial peptide transport system permease subunit
MIRVALRGLAGRKLRAALTAIAIVLGVAMVSGSYVLTDTIDKAFKVIFVESYAGTDAVVSGKGADFSFEGESAAAPPVPEAVLDQVRAVDGVEVATGSVGDDQTKLLAPDGEAIDTGGAPALAFGFDTSPQYARFNPLDLVEGRWPAGSGEIVVDEGAASDEDIALGERVGVAALGPTRELEVVGIARYGGVSSIGSATFAIFDLRTGQELFQKEGQLDTVQAAAEPGVSPEELVQRLRAELGTSFVVNTGTEQAEEDSSEIATFTRIIRYFLLTFAGVALFVGAFVIFNTLSITVAQRTREFATLRTIGASRRQVLSSVVIEALVIGLLASIIGLFTGLGLAVGLNALFVAFNLDLPHTETVFATRTIVVALVVGVGVTLVAGLFPALRATRVPPIAAVREGATLPRSALSRYVPLIAGLTVLIAVLSLSYGMLVDDLETANRFFLLGVGVLALFFGVALLSARLVRPVASGAHPVGEWLVVVLLVVLYPFTLAYWLQRYAFFEQGAGFGRRAGALVAGTALGLFLLPIVLAMWVVSTLTRFTPEWPVDFPNVRREPTMSDIGRENARRNPGRTAATAAALMIGIALVTFVGVLAEGIRGSNSEAIERQIQADLIVTSQDGYSEFPAAVGDALTELQDTDVVSNVRQDAAEVDGTAANLTGLDESIAEVYDFRWVEGSDEVLATLGPDGAVVPDNVADDHELGVGDSFMVLSAENERQELVVRGIYDGSPFYPLLGSASVSQDAFDRLYERPRNRFTLVNVPGGPTEAQQERLEAALGDFPDTRVFTRQEWIDKEDAEIGQFLTLLYVLLALSVVISIFGMVNTLALSVFERTRELGMLRAVGTTRRQIRRMIRHESVITALIGTTLGLPLGIFLALLVTRALAQYDLQFAIPTVSLIVFVVVAAITGVVAAIVPARRAARLRVLEALQYE